MGTLSDALSAFPGTAAVLLGLSSIFIGALVQGSLGFGMGLVSIPVLGMLVPERLPQTVVLAVLPLSVFMLWHERDALRPGLTTWLIAGRLIGVVPAVAVLAVMPERALQAVIAVTTLAAVTLMVLDRVTVEITRRNQLVAGTLSGFIGTTAGIGGPPVASLYAHQTGRTLRATLALVTVVGNVVTLLGYWVGDRLGAADLWLGGIFLVPTVLGLAAGVLVRPHLHGARLRRAVLVLVAASALALLWRAVTG